MLVLPLPFFALQTLRALGFCAAASPFFWLKPQAALKYCMQYTHAWSDTLLDIPRNRSIVIDPASWGYPTTGPRDQVDMGTLHSPRFWNNCADQASGAPRLINGVSWDTIDYVDFKLFDSSKTCDVQWQTLQNWLALEDRERVLHIVNDGAGFIYDEPWLRRRIKDLNMMYPVHLEFVARVTDLNQEADAVHSVKQCLKQNLKYRSCVITVVWHKYARVHILKHPRFEAGQVLVKPY